MAASWGILPLLLVLAVSARAEQVPFEGHRVPTKRIAVVGMGAAGISSLKAIMSLPEDMRTGWHVEAFEQREAVGGLWLPQDNPPNPPEIPATPLYPILRTNGPHPFQTLPHIPFPPETPLLAPRESVLQYHRGVVTTFNLSSYVKLRHVIHRAEWIGDSQSGFWDVAVEDIASGVLSHCPFDHLIAAPGVNHFPALPSFAGQDNWLAANKTIEHCVYFRDPRVYKDRTLVVVGVGPSGWDMVQHIPGHAKKVYWSHDTRKENPASPEWPHTPGVPDKPRITSLANASVHFADGTVLHDVDTILLATGYVLRFPFLTAGGHLTDLERDAEQPADRLTSNGRYIYPLYEHTVSLDPAYPVGALYFNGLLLYNPTGMTDYGQALWTAYTLAEPRLLSTRSEFLAALQAREARIREAGLDPARLGHKAGIGYGPFAGHNANGSFEDLLVHHIRDNGFAGFPGIPRHGENFTEPWRLTVMEFGDKPLYAWNAGEKRVGKKAWNERWTKGRRTEEDYVEVVKGVMEWWDKVKDQDEEQNDDISRASSL